MVCPDRMLHCLCQAFVLTYSNALIVVRIVPVSQIHGLDPSSQPRAWLDVLASADTSNDEKTEAMEEILILAKDKQRARIFLEVRFRSVFLVFC
jgi:hypothetical protein